GGLKRSKQRKGISRPGQVYTSIYLMEASAGRRRSSFIATRWKTTDEVISRLRFIRMERLGPYGSTDGCGWAVKDRRYSLQRQKAMKAFKATSKLVRPFVNVAARISVLTRRVTCMSSSGTLS